MRIISQNKCFDIPYDRFLVGLIKVEDVVEMYARDEKGTEFILADYKTISQAQAEMQQIRIAYTRGIDIYMMEGNECTAVENEE